MPPRKDPELKRLLALTKYEQEARAQGHILIAGVDEAGRGPLAGPVIAAACIIPEGVFFRGVDDSKKLTADQREVLFQEITSHPDVIYGIGSMTSEEIDRINIYQATIQAMLKAVKNLSTQPHFLLIDAVKLPHPTIPIQSIIQGDAKSQSIAAASIIAKVTRDRMMNEIHQEWPMYGFNQHKGYSTPQHFKALAEHGSCPYHRQSFEPVRNLKPSMQLDLL